MSYPNRDFFNHNESITQIVENILLKLLNVLTSSSIYLGINSALVIYFSSQLFNVDVNIRTLTISFLATYTVYNFNNFTDIDEDTINLQDVPMTNKKIRVISTIISLVLCLFYSTLEGFNVLLIILYTFIASLLYSIRFFSSIPRLKDVVGIKSILVASSWALTGTFLPLTQNTVHPDTVNFVYFYIFTQLLINTIICDIRDMKGDIIARVRTLPVILGIDTTKKFLFFLNSLMLSWLIRCFLLSYYTEYLPALFFGVLYSYFLIWSFSNEKRSRLTVELFVDGQWIPVILLMMLIR